MERFLQIAAKFEPFPDMAAVFARNRGQKKSPFRSFGIKAFKIERNGDSLQSSIGTAYFLGTASRLPGISDSVSEMLFI